MSTSLIISVVLNVFAIFIPSPWTFYIIFGFCLGINATFLSYPLIWISWRIFPERKGFIAGLSAAPYIFAPFFTGALFTFIVNCENDEGYVKDHLIYFNETIYSKVPIAFLALVGINLVLGLTAIIFVRGEQSQKQEKTKSSLTILGLFQQSNFWYLFFSLLFKVIFYQILINVYKNLAIYYFNDDHFSNIVSGIAFMSCGMFKIILGALFDVYSWNKLNLIFIFIEISLILIAPLMWSNKILFTLWASSSLSVSGINFISVWVLTDKLYNKEKWVMSFVAIALIVDILIVNFFMGVVVPWVGYVKMFYILLTFQGISLLLGIFPPNLEKKSEEMMLLG